MTSNDQYERNELRAAHNQEEGVNKAPLQDRKEAQKEFLEAMASDPALVAERLGWLIDGNYGYGAMLRAKQVVAAPRMNREAILTQLIAVYEWQCPARMAVDAWKKLTAGQKKELSRAVQVVIEAAEKEEE